jgi:hypothetical protein
MESVSSSERGPAPAARTVAVVVEEVVVEEENDEVAGPGPSYH